MTSAQVYKVDEKTRLGKLGEYSSPPCLFVFGWVCCQSFPRQLYRPASILGAELLDHGWKWGVREKRKQII